MGSLQEELAKKLGRKLEEPKEEQKNWDEEYKKYNTSGRSKKTAPPAQKRTTTDTVKIPKNIPEPPKATAPYNFISLPTAVLRSPLQGAHDWAAMSDAEIKGAFKQYLTEQPTYSGTITLSLENLTPLFIGTGNTSETFFAPAGKPIIPGSTLRGMVRSLFKIITAGAMRRNEDFTDRHLYYRCLMAPKKMPQLFELHNEYVRRMLSDVKDKNGKIRQVKNAKPGFLFRKKQDSAYAIVPCQMQSKERADFGYVGKDSCVAWDEKNKIASILTGNQHNKNYIRCLSNPDWDNVVPVPDEVIVEYRNDRNRRGVDLLDETSKNVKVSGSASAFVGRDDIDFLAPCFFIREQGKVTAFGHGRSFRIPYKHSVGDRVPKALQTEDIDFTDAVFGKSEYWAGRVSFEDAVLQSVPNFAPADYVKPLLGANPTSYQLYLDQDQYPPAHWDSDNAGMIRGYKQYWHKRISNRDWQAQSQMERNTKLTHIIQPLASGNTFTAAIHFRELRDIELGALLNVFFLADKDQDIVFKIGQGKSLGMGSVRIKAALHLDTKAWYTSFLQDNRWAAAAAPASFMTAFESYVKEQLGQGQKAYQQSLTELRLMLDWNNTKRPDWSKKTASMSGDVQAKTVDERFVKKSLLPKPGDIVK